MSVFARLLINKTDFAHQNSKRSNLSHYGLFICSVAYCESKPFQSKRRRRKHVFTKHGSYYCFEEKPGIAKVFLNLITRTSNYELPTWQVKTFNILLFLKSCVVGVDFKKYRQGPGGGGKDEKSLHRWIFLKVRKTID